MRLTVKDVLNINIPHTQTLYSQLPPTALEVVNNTHIKFNDSINDVFIWFNNKNGVYSTKSGYNWLLSCTDQDAIATPTHT